MCHTVGDMMRTSVKNQVVCLREVATLRKNNHTQLGGNRNNARVGTFFFFQDRTRENVVGVKAVRAIEEP